MSTTEKVCAMFLAAGLVGFIMVKQFINKPNTEEVQKEYDHIFLE